MTQRWRAPRVRPLPPSAWERQQRTRTGLGRLRRMLAVAANPATYGLADALPEKEPGSAGRPTDYPNWALLLYGCLIRVCGSARAVAEELDDPVVWSLLLDEAVRVLDGGEGRHQIAVLRCRPAPRRHHWVHFTRKWAGLPDGIVEEFSEEYRRGARELALATGLLSPDAQFLLAKPDLRHFVAFDGKVMSALSKHRQAEAATGAPARSAPCAWTRRRAGTPRPETRGTCSGAASGSWPRCGG